MKNSKNEIFYLIYLNLLVFILMRVLEVFFSRSLVIIILLILLIIAIWFLKLLIIIFINIYKQKRGVKW